jgi:hypothetical protein
LTNMVLGLAFAEAETGGQNIETPMGSSRSGVYCKDGRS